MKHNFVVRTLVCTSKIIVKKLFNIPPKLGNFGERVVQTKVRTTVLILFAFQMIHAQKTISLEEALKKATMQQPMLKKEQLMVAYKQKLSALPKRIAPTQITTEFGQINSVFFDTKLIVAQSFNLPKVYQTQRSVWKEEAKIAQINIEAKTRMIEKEVEQTFFTLLFQQNKLNWLQKNDSLNNFALEKANKRLQVGQSNVLEINSLALQKKQWELFLLQTKAEQEVALLQFQLLLNADMSLIPGSINNKQLMDFANSEDNIKQLPNLKLVEQEKQVITAQIAHEKALLLPEFQIGLSNGSIRGVGADNENYSAASRFTSLQVGATIPIFKKAQQQKIAIEQMNVEIAQSVYNQQNTMLKTKLNQEKVNFETAKKTLQFYENDLLPTARKRNEIINQQFNGGEIDYLDWHQMYKEHNQIEMSYLDAVYQFWQAYIALKYLEF